MVVVFVWDNFFVLEENFCKLFEGSNFLGFGVSCVVVLWVFIGWYVLIFLFFFVMILNFDCGKLGLILLLLIEKFCFFICLCFFFFMFFLYGYY